MNGYVLNTRICTINTKGVKRWWGGRWHQAITRTNFDLSSIGYVAFPREQSHSWKYSWHQSVKRVWKLYLWITATPDSKAHGANMGPTWVLSSPGGPHVGSMNLAIRDGPLLETPHRDHWVQITYPPPIHQIEEPYPITGWEHTCAGAITGIHHNFEGPGFHFSGISTQWPLGDVVVILKM